MSVMCIYMPIPISIDPQTHHPWPFLGSPMTVPDISRVWDSWSPGFLLNPRHLDHLDLLG